MWHSHSKDLPQYYSYTTLLQIGAKNQDNAHAQSKSVINHNIDGLFEEGIINIVSQILMVYGRKETKLNIASDDNVDFALL